MSLGAREGGGPFSSGALVGGKYRVGALLQRGGMGAVYVATHELLEQRVALKVLRADLSEDPASADRFLREARASARLKSDHVVKVFDVGVHEGIPYMAMELLEGEDLADTLAGRGALPVDEALGIARQAVEAIVAAHADGIIHRDLKPANLFLEQRPGKPARVKVLDFGISKVSTGARADLTATRALLGTPGYMSPEQIRSARTVDERTDVWAIGVILWEMLAGEIAFDGATPGDVFARIREEPLAPLASRRRDLPPGLSSLVARCVERDRDARVASAGALAVELAVIAQAGARAEEHERAIETSAVVACDRDALSSPDFTRDATLAASSLTSDEITIERHPGTPESWIASQLPPPRPQRSTLAVAIAGVACGALVTWGTIATRGGIFELGASPIAPAPGAPHKIAPAKAAPPAPPVLAPAGVPRAPIVLPATSTPAKPDRKKWGF
jgi:serine/threonine protein kinase